jgi:hypothetical protein
MKTIREYLNELPKGYKELAFKDAFEPFLDNYVIDMYHALKHAFSMQTMECKDYKFWWLMQMYYAAIKAEMPELPKE